MNIKIETPSNYYDHYIDDVKIVPRIGEQVLVVNKDMNRYSLLVKDVIYDYSDNSILVIVS